MIGFQITAPGMTTPELIAFVRKHMPSTEELVRRAKLAGLEPNRPIMIFEVCACYKHIPTKGSNLRFPKHQPRRMPQVMQLASGQDDWRILREGICHIVHRHLIRAFKRSRKKYIDNII